MLRRADRLSLQLKRKTQKRRQLFLEQLEERSLLASVVTDKLDYAPAETALITASGFRSGESVQFQVLHNDGTPNTGNGHFPWTVTDGSAADLDGAVNGNIRTSWYVDPDDSAFSSFSLTANGLLSGLSASTTFTDAPAADLDHYGNVSGGWQDGNLGDNKASYLEGQSVPDRISFTDLTPGVSYTITISYDTTKAGKHAFDYLTTYNRTVNPDPKEGISGVNSLTTTFAIPVDANVTKGQNGIDDGPVGPTGGDDISQVPGNFTYFGGTITAVSGYTRSPDNYTTDSTTSITVTFTPASATSVLAWGAHIGTRQDWGQNNSAVAITGSPYHVALAGASANLGNVGSQDHQLQSAAIIFPGQITVIKDVTGGQDPQDFSFAISASAGTQPSPANFVLDDDSNSATPDTQVFSITNFVNYTVAETLLAGWTTSITVTDPNGVVTPVNNNQNTFAVAEGENWTLVFNNFKLSPALNIVKDATVPGGTADAAGDVISYVITVQNTGNQNLTGVTVSDPFVSNLLRGTDLVGDNDNILEIGETWRYAASHIVTQAEVDAGGNIVNTATADSNETGPDTDDATIPVTQSPALNIIKDASVPGGTANSVGEVISYAIQVQNTGNQTLTGVTVVDPFISNLTRITDQPGDNDNSLEVGETWRYTATHAVTQAEIDAGTNIVNTATADSNQTGPDTDDAQIPVTQSPALNIVKDASVAGGTADAAGEVISYTIAVQNTGNQTLTNVSVSDPFISNLTRITDQPGDNDNSLEVGETWRYTASHIVTQAEIDAGVNIVNTATVDSNQTGPDTDDAQIPVTQSPALNIVKDASVAGGTADAAGEVITYTIAVQNTGNQTLTGVTVVDPFISNLTRITDQPGDNDNSLEVGETWRYTASHIVTQAEIDAGVNIVNTATADSNQTGPDTDDAQIPVTQSPALNIVKDASVAGGTADAAGEVISYTIAAQNTGNQTLTGVTVVDPFISNLTRITDQPGDNDNSLEVGETWRYTATHAVTQAEIDAGVNIVNTATADSNQTGPDTDDAQIPVTQSPALNIVKDASVAGGTADAAGEVISYTIAVQNTGNQTLTGVTVVDPFISNLTRITDQPGDNDNSLEVGETWRYTATHAVTQAEIDAGVNIVNTATADSNQTGPDTDDAQVPVTQSPALNIVKDATVPGGTADFAGETISYTIAVQNTGNQTLTGVTVVDPFISNLTRITDQPGDNDNSLEVGETWRYTASHIVTQAEVDAGVNIVNTATADSDQTGPDTDDAQIPVTQSPALNIVKDATVPGGTADFAGEIISYTISVQNTGSQTLTNVTVVDPFISNLTRITDQPGDNDNSLEVGETWRYTASHIVTQAEIDAGVNIVNTATADSDQTGPDTDDAQIPVTQSPALNIVKDASVAGGTADAAGEVISYTIAVQNTGNQTLTGVTVVDPFISNLTRITDQPGDNDNSLEVGETWRYTATHAVTQAEIDAGVNIVNTATADSNQTGPDTDDAQVPVTQSPALNIVKDATVPGGTADFAGEIIAYTIAVQNTGNQTLTGVTVVDPFISNLTRITDQPGDNDNSLEVGETWRYIASHIVTQAEIDAGVNIVNTATADSDQTGPDTDDAQVPVTQSPALNIVKDASVAGGTADAAGEVITYTITVQNTGNQTLTGVTVVDPFISNLTRITDQPGDNDNSLEVGETWRYLASHIVTQAEIDAGVNIVNTATADSDQTGPDTDDAQIPVTQSPAINIVKDASVAGGTADAAGEVITYTIAVQNTGNQTLTNVSVSDPFISNLTRITDQPGDNDNSLEVGETWRYTASHVVTQAEIDAGVNIVNTAAADSDQTPPDTDDAFIPVTQNPSLNIVKDAIVAGGTANVAGEVITYTITVQNTGNQTLTNVSVSDPFISNLSRVADLVGNNNNLLEVGETWAFTASHVVTQVEIDSGANIINIATADSNETPPDTDDSTIPVEQNALLDIVKNASVPGGTADLAGEVITYSITVQNTGNTTLTNVIVSDPYISNLLRINDVVGDNDNLLEVGETWAYTASHVVTQLEIDTNGGLDGFLENVATADSNESPPDSDDASVPVDRNPAINIIKDAFVTDGILDTVGELINYRIFIQNIGNVTLDGSNVSDDRVTILSRVADVVGDNDALFEVGEIWQFNATIPVTQDQLDAGQIIHNVATVTTFQTPPDDDDADVPVVQIGGIVVVKEVNGHDANTAPGVTVSAGSNVTFTFDVSNFGNAALSNVTVTDNTVSPVPVLSGGFNSGDLDQDNLLDVGEVWHYIATAPGQAGQHTNTATATGLTSTGEDAIDTDDGNYFGSSPAIQVVKLVNGNDANTPPGVFVPTGSNVTFTFEVTNLGNIELSSINLSDSTVVPTPILSGGFNVGDTDQDGKLDLGETWLYTANASAVAGQHTNIALVSGSSPTDQFVTDTDPGNYFGVAAAVDIEKFVNGQDADVAPGPTLTNGSTAVFTYVVTNTGNVPLANVAVVDDNGTPGNPADDFNATFTGGDTIANGLLDLGETWTYSASRVVTAGPYSNIGRVTASDPNTATTASDTDAANYFGQSTILVITPDKTNSSLPFVHLVELETGSLVRRFQAYELAYRGGVRVATGDLNGDGVDEIIVAPGRGHTPVVKVFDQLGNLKTSFLAYASTFTGGVEVAVADINGDGKNDIVTAMSYNGNQVKVFRNASAFSFPLFSAFEPFGSAFKGGATIDAADLGNAITVGATKTLSSTNFNLHRAEIVVGNGSGMRSTVKVFTYFGINNAAANNAAILVRTFLPFSASYKGGVSLDLARVDGDLVPDLIVSAGNGGGSQVQVLDGDSPGVVLKGFTPYSSASSAPVHTVAVDRNGDGMTDFILTAQGTDGASRKIRRFNSDLPNPTVVDAIFETHPDFAGAYFLATLKRSAPPRLY